MIIPRNLHSLVGLARVKQGDQRTQVSARTAQCELKDHSETISDTKLDFRTHAYLEISAMAGQEATWSRFHNDIISASDLVKSKPKDFERLDILYRRCLNRVPGFQGKVVEESAEFHKYVLAAIQMIEHGWPDIVLKELCAELARTFQKDLDDELIGQAVDIAVCLWLSIDCVGPKLSMPKGWPDGNSIHDFVMNRKFDDPTEVSFGDPIARFPPKFRAARLKEISGISIKSTIYLDQHLRFNEETRTLKIFVDAVWLNAMCERFRKIRDTAQKESRKTSHDSAGTRGLPHSGQLPSTTSLAQNALGTSSQAKRNSICDVHPTSLAFTRHVSGGLGSCGGRRYCGTPVAIINQVNY